MEVEDLIEDDKCEIQFIADAKQQAECVSDNVFSSGKSQSNGPEDDLWLECENLEEVNVEESNPLHDTTAVLGKLDAQSEEIVPSTVPSLNVSHIDHFEDVECSNIPGGLVGSISTTSTVCTSWKPDFSKLKGEICLDNLSVKELHETFKATFGRETSVKDKQWLKRRISMGLTNSCDVSTTTFIIEDYKVVKKGKEESCKSMDGSHAEDPLVDAINENCGGSADQDYQIEECSNVFVKRLQNPNLDCSSVNEDLCVEQRTAKRVRKPTRRYIEEVSEVESREYMGKPMSSVKSSGHGQSSTQARVRPVQHVRSDGRLVVTRQDSLGGSGVQVPYVSRVRRGRPRENYMALMKLQPSGMGTAARLVKKAFGVRGPRSDKERGNKVFKARLAPLWVQQPLISEPEKEEQYLEREKVELEKDVELKDTDSSGNNSDDNVVTVPTAKGGMRRKHHRPWTLSEVLKLVEGVGRYGAGRWSEIKRIAFASYSYRTSVDLKDKWRNLLRASFAQLPEEKGMQNSRKHASIPIPASILVRVRELAEMQSQVPPEFSLSSRFAGHGGRSVQETRPGYL
ncbi:hypothetical protein LguiA_028815 [Lonicera macranthoides]